MSRTEAHTIVAALTLAVAIVGCESTPVDPGEDSAQTALAFAVMSSSAERMGGEQPYVHECPAGGSLVVDGTVTVDSHADGSVTMWNHTAQFNDCTLSRHGRTITANGQMTTTGEARFGPPVDQHAPLIYQLSHQTGSLTMSSEGAMETCTYDLQHQFERENNRYRITGTACGRPLSLTAPAHP